MKNLINNSLAITLVCVLSLLAINLNAQCDNWTFGENDFMSLAAMQSGNGSSAPSVEMIDIDGDGTMDVTATMTAVVVNAACGTGTPYEIAGTFNSTGSNALGTSSDLAADFNSSNSGTPTTTCECSGGYVQITYTFINGWNSDLGSLSVGQSSNNGSSEGYEGSFGWVSAGTNAAGVPLTALPTINMANFSNYCNAQYAGGTQMSTFLGATGVYAYQTDQLNATVNDCATSGQNGEDTGSGAGGTNGTNGSFGGTATDLITEINHVYFYSTAPGSDCDDNGTVGANSNPSGSLQSVGGCFLPPCGFPEPTITLEEDCGIYNIVVGAIDESGASGNGTVVTYDTAFADPWTSTTAVTGVEGLTADGTTQIWINIADSDDANCNDTFGPFTAPFGEVPDCDKGGAFPANPGN